MIRVQTADGPIIVAGALRDKTISLLAEAPTSPSVNDVWYDLSVDKLKRWDGTQWVLATTRVHSEMTGLGNDDHIQYALANGTRGSFATTAQGAKADTAIQPAQFDPVQTKVAGIEVGATADQTASEILAALLTVDGAGSTLDADLLDGQDGAYYRNRANHTGTQTAATISDFGVAVDSRMATLVGRRDVTAATTLELADGGKVLRVNSASAVTVTIPTNASVAFALDTVIQVYSLGAGAVTIAGASGVTVRNNNAALKQYQEVSLRKDGTDEWVRVG